MSKQIEAYIEEKLFGEMRRTALDFVGYLKSNGLTFDKDNGGHWKDKIYYLVKFGGEYVCFIVIKDPDEPNNFWTVWSCGSSAYVDCSVCDEIKNVGLRYVDFCVNCGSCGGGKDKVIFGERFSRVCPCTFRIDNALSGDLPFLKTIADLRIGELLRNAAVKHYDLLIGEDNDPARDPKPLRDYMDKWDGRDFIDKMQLDSEKSVLEIGVGTGRLAVRIAPLCGRFCGIDISPKTVERAGENLSNLPCVDLICGDFLTYEFSQTFDVIYSSLTFMHIKEKQKAINKAAALLGSGGRFVLSVDKNQSDFIDVGINRITVFPDNPEDIKLYIAAAGLELSERYETEFAHIFVAIKP